MSIESLLDFASGHHGLLRLRDAHREQVGRKVLDRLCQRSILEFLTGGVYRVRGSADSWHQRALAGVWTTGGHAQASHRTGGAIWGLPRARRSGIEVLVPRGSGAHTRWARQHETRHLTASDVDEHNAIPVTSIERTLVDLAATLPMGELARWLDDADALELTSFRAVAAHLRGMPTQGRKGVRVLRVLLKERIGTPLESKDTFEEIVRRILERANLPTPVRQQVVEHGTDRYYLDFAWPEYMVAVECDGMVGHSKPSAQVYDLHRQNVVIEAGWNLRRFPWSEVHDHPDRVLDMVHRALVTNGWTPPPLKLTPTSPAGGAGGVSVR